MYTVELAQEVVQVHLKSVSIMLNYVLQWFVMCLQSVLKVLYGNWAIHFHTHFPVCDVVK